MQATAYKFNKEIHMPRPESPSKEILHEVRKKDMNKIFDRVTTSKGKSNVDLDSNLSANELKGLKSLRKRISHIKYNNVK